MLIFLPIMLFSNAQKCSRSVPIIPNTLPISYAQIKPIMMLTKTDMRHNETVTLSSSAAISVLSCAWVQKWVPADWSTLYQSIIRSPGVVMKVDLATRVVVCPKILKIMPVDAYNASIILKCLQHTYYAQNSDGIIYPDVFWYFTEVLRGFI